MSKPAVYVLSFFVLLLFALGVMGLGQGRRTGLAAARYPAEGRFVEVDGVSLHYEEAGRGKPVLLIHGSPGLTRDFKVVPPPDPEDGEQRLSLYQDLSRDHRVIAIDRPGHGWSGLDGGKGTGLLRQAELVAGFLKEIGAAPATVVGHSYGGSLTLAMAVEQPRSIEAAVIVGAPAYSDAFTPEPVETVGARRVIGPVFNWTLGGAMAGRVIHDELTEAFAPHPIPEGYEEMFAIFVARPLNLYQRAYELDRLPAELDRISRHYSALDLPLTIVLGSVDSEGVRKSAIRLSDSFFGLLRVRNIRDLGHEVPHIEPEILAYEIRSVTKGARAAVAEGG